MSATTAELTNDVVPTPATADCGRLGPRVESSPGVSGPPSVAAGIPAYFEFWLVLRRQKGRVVLMTALGSLAAWLVCWAIGPRYDSTTQLLVIKKRLDTTPLTGPEQNRAADDFLSTHMLLITSRRVVKNAIERGELGKLQQFQDRPGLSSALTAWFTHAFLGPEETLHFEDRLTNKIIASLVVTRDAQRPGINPSNEVLNLSFRGNVAAECPKVLQAIVDSYQDFLKETYRNTNAETVELIAQARQTVQKDLEVKEAAYQKFVTETPPLWNTHDRNTAQQDRLLKIDAKLSALRMRRTETEASITMIQNAIQRGDNATATVVRLLGPVNDPNVPAPATPRLSLEQELIALELQKAKLESVFPKNHTEVLAIHRQIQLVCTLIYPKAKPSDDPEANTGVNLGTLKLELLRRELEDLKIAEAALAKLFNAEQAGVSASYIHEIQNEAHRKGIERDRMLYESIVNRLKETSSVRDFGGYNTQVIGPALPGTLALRRYLFIFGVSTFVGLSLGFLWAFVAEFARRGNAAAGMV